MNKKIIIWSVAAATLVLAVSSCKIFDEKGKTENTSLPASYTSSQASGTDSIKPEMAAIQDSINSATKSWSDFFTDPNLVALIDSALVNNQELNIMLQEINVAKAEVQTRKGEFIPFLNVKGGAGAEKVGRYTSQGANDANTEIMPGKDFPEPLPDFVLKANASWEVDIWKKLRNSRDAAASRYLSSVEGKNFMVTNIVSEIANSYFELLALDNKLQILQQNIEIQTNALEIVRLQKESAKVTELAVKKFEAEVYKNQSRQYYIKQEIIETENKINFLVGRTPQPVQRTSVNFEDLIPDYVYTGVPSQLLDNRPDIKQAELELTAAKLDIKVAKANFYPSLRLTASLGSQTFNPGYMLQLPESMLYSLAGDMVAPLINRNALKAQYATANSKQIQAVYNYEQHILNAYIEVANQVSMINNLKLSYDLKEKQVAALKQSIEISTDLFKSARADYMEVLLTQRDALDSRFELIETKMQQMHAMINIYQALGGGWR